MVSELRGAMDRAVSDAPGWGVGVDDFVAAGRRLRRRRRARWAAGSSVAAVLLAVAGGYAAPALRARMGGPAPGGTVLVGPAAGGPEPSGSPSGTPPPSGPSREADPDAPSGPGAPSGRSGQAATPGPSTGAVRVAVPVDGFGFTLAAYRVAAFQVGAPTATAPTYQRAPVYQDGVTTRTTDVRGVVHSLPRAVGELVVYRPGAYAPPVPGTPVDVAGEHGRRWTGGGRVSLAWPYAPGAWAVLTAQQDAGALVAALPRLAAGLVGGPERVAGVPFRLRYVPPGFRVTEAAEGSYPGSQIGISPDQGTLAAVRLSRPVTGGPPPGTPSVAPSVAPSGDVEDAGARGQIQVDLVRNPRATNPVRSGERVGLQPGCRSATFCYLWSQDGEYLLEATGSADVPQAELLRLVAGVSLVDPGDRAGWVDVAAALPAP